MKFKYKNLLNSVLPDDDQPSPQTKKFVKTGTVIRETVDKFSESTTNSKKPNKKTD